MTGQENKALVFRKIPSGPIKVGEDVTVEDIGIDLAEPLDEGSVLVKNIYISLDPYMRGRLRPASTKSYAPAFELNKPLTSVAVARILKSNNTCFTEGQLISVFDSFSEYSVVSARDLARAQVLNKATTFDVANHLGTLGLPGLTAYAALYEIGKPKKGETIFVTTAAGAVGQVVVQLAKREGLTVIANAGDDKKVEFLKKELGVEAAFNYKKENTHDALDRLAPEGIDIFYDNVGGETLDAALLSLKEHGRVIGYGAISQYNLKPEDQHLLKNLNIVLIAKRLTIRGFVIFDPDFGPKYAQQHLERVGKWLADGSFKSWLHVTRGMDRAGDALLELFNGENFGKAVVEID